MATRVSAAEYAQYKRNLSGQRDPTRGQRLYASARATGAKGNTYAKERARATVRTAGRGAGQQAQRARGGFGALFTVATVAGIAILVIKRPALITVPLAFISGIFRAFTTLAGKVTGR